MFILMILIYHELRTNWLIFMARLGFSEKIIKYGKLRDCTKGN